jgi:hypothetical protein
MPKKITTQQGAHIMTNESIEDIILEYCEGFEHLEFNYKDLPKMVERIKEELAAEPECPDCNVEAYFKAYFRDTAQ